MEETLGRISDSENEKKMQPKMLFVELNTEEEPPEKPKRKFRFLKRGEGLSRFRLTPRDIALQNKRIQATKDKSGGQKVGDNTKKDRDVAKKSVTVPTRSGTAKPSDVKTVTKGRTKRGAPVLTVEGKVDK
jgi:hypothetical protein